MHAYLINMHKILLNMHKMVLLQMVPHSFWNYAFSKQFSKQICPIYMPVVLFFLFTIKYLTMFAIINSSKHTNGTSTGGNRTVDTEVYNAGHKPKSYHQF